MKKKKRGRLKRHSAKPKRKKDKQKRKQPGRKKRSKREGKEKKERFVSASLNIRRKRRNKSASEKKRRKEKRESARKELSAMLRRLMSATKNAKTPSERFMVRARRSRVKSRT